MIDSDGKLVINSEINTSPEPCSFTRCSYLFLQQLVSSSLNHRKGVPVAVSNGFKYKYNELVLNIIHWGELINNLLRFSWSFSASFYEVLIISLSFKKCNPLAFLVFLIYAHFWCLSSVTARRGEPLTGN